jgi:hypothetical protein
MSDPVVNVLLFAQEKVMAFFQVKVGTYATQIDVTLSTLQNSDVTVASVLLMCARAITINEEFQDTVNDALDTLTDFSMKRDREES